MPIFRRENGTLVAVPGNYAFLDQLGKLTADSMLIRGLVSQTHLGGGTYFGFEAGLNDDTINRHNTGVGFETIKSNTTGYYNSAMGMHALRYNLTGNRNTAVGLNTLKYNTDGHSNTAVGMEALRNNETGVRNIAMGCFAGRYALGSDAFYVDNLDRLNNTNEKLNSIIYGIMAELAADQKLTFNAAVTVNGRLGQIGLGGSTYLGFEAGKVDDLTDNLNTGIGYQTLLANTTGDRNVAMGYGALLNNNGYRNVGVGYQALKINTTGDYNTALGFDALYSNSTGSRNIGMGYYAGFYELGNDAFYINNQDRTDTAGDKAKSIIYGIMAALVADQKLTFNADVKITGKTGLNNVTPVGKAAHIADPTDLDTAITAIKAILVVLENLGAVATA